MARRWILATLFVAFSAGAALADDTGGSMGGGDWSSGGGGGGGGWSSSDDSYSFSSGDGSGADLPAGVWIAFGAIALVVWVISQVNQRSGVNDGLSLDSTPDAPSFDSVDVTVLRIAIDGRARKFVQSELARIAKIADTKTPDGRATMLREVALLLRRLRDAWVYGGAVNEPMRDIAGAKGVFDRYVDDARVRFREETIRNEQGQITTAVASPAVPRSDQGAGLILVSIIIAARRELFTVNAIDDGDDLRHALESASQLTPQNLVAIEIVWQPSEEDDRVSSMQLEAKYPRPELIPIRGALVGKTFCTYCGGPFPAELVSCPHCGAPAPGREAAAAKAA